MRHSPCRWRNGPLRAQALVIEMSTKETTADTRLLEDAELKLVSGGATIAHYDKINGAILFGALGAIYDAMTGTLNGGLHR